MIVFGDLFCGGGGAATGAIAAGLEHAWGLELDPQIAEVYRENIGDCFNQNILDADPLKFEKPDWLHASPPCQAFSTANANRGERQLEIDCARKVAEFIEVLQPKYFSLENVEAYKRSHSFNLIVDTLNRLGYWSNWQILNAADFGVPQSRRRLILLAIKGGFLPSLPPKERHVGWYEAIAHLVHDLPDAQLADWQLNALPEDLRENLRHMQKQKNILIENTGARSDRPLQTRDAGEPSWTIRAMGHDGHWHRANALLVHPTEQRNCVVRLGGEPAFTLKANAGGNLVKSVLGRSRVVQLDINCLAALQSFPSTYKWTGKKSLDGKIIGNSVPPLLLQKLIENIVRANDMS
jgi:DNA (cytosine-5)-methyltransferase 1